MFITTSRSGYLGNDQYASGYFLIVFSNDLAPKLPNGRKALRCLIRKVALRQFGHFMMSSVTLLGVRFSLSGCYGADGLTVDVATRQKERPDPPLPEGGHKTVEEHKAYWDEVASIPWVTVEKAPGLWDRLHPMPDELVEKFWSGGGHNSSGSEGPAVHKWAKENLGTLCHLLPKPKKAAA